MNESDHVREIHNRDKKPTHREIQGFAGESGVAG